MKVKDLIGYYDKDLLNFELTLEIRRKDNVFYKRITVNDFEVLLKDEISEEEIIAWFVYHEKKIVILINKED